MHHYHSNQLSNRSKEIEGLYSNKLISSERISKSFERNKDSCEGTSKSFEQINKLYGNVFNFLIELVNLSNLSNGFVEQISKSLDQKCALFE